MQIYIILFLNAIIFRILTYMEIELFIEKVNILSLLSVTYIFIHAIYNKHFLKRTYHIPEVTIVVLLGLIAYNYLFAHKSFLILSIFLLVLVFVLDNIYNSIKLNTKINGEQKNEKTRYSYEESQQEQFQEQQQSFEDEFKNYINTQLERSLVLFSLSHDYTLLQLKKAYKKAAHLNHPDKFQDRDKWNVPYKLDSSTTCK
ncbi:hypothetical protein SMGD1_2007 [Sulfurimonas gotlandica GD1]|uniref:J domain-containing protein n=1 Tax=Sulfurimonas gotlandica (strain DSM 19862 / JCM 16533 / GD1) TaxID=929558 RepID=B6BJ15_SULGG|nr:hypothetical protein [Sulfurimonas gotlandica]EDZ62950.1 hypothetical protein CBGD1_568 [Sulfurimonas gotlandica GD1]EHP30530.1 hypothetical protein SMGD1_2007 [Sulfurimonas gotlandica GD1]